MRANTSWIVAVAITVAAVAAGCTSTRARIGPQPPEAWTAPSFVAVPVPPAEPQGPQAPAQFAVGEQSINSFRVIRKTSIDLAGTSPAFSREVPGGIKIEIPAIFNPWASLNLPLPLLMS